MLRSSIRRSSQAAFSLIEVVIALAILTVSIGAVCSTLFTTTGLSRANRETSLAAEAALSAIEAVRGADFAQAFAQFNVNPNDDAVAPGTAPGASFAVRGLDVRDGDVDGFVGEILFPGDGTNLREDVLDRALGMPRDLNGDSVIDAIDHSGDYVLLPIRVRVEWTGASGNRDLEFVSTVTFPGEAP